jgi:hypothetical protein
MAKSRLWAIVLMVFLVGGNVFVSAQEISPDLCKALGYRDIGPPGNRTAAVVGVPGDISSSVDFAPNKQQREVFAMLKERLAVQKTRFDELLKTELPTFKTRLADKNIPGIVVSELK